ncbi:heavy metal translocating P-type ATPase [Rubeoparvulum massiliense]|uniref:heavy metal translocating P-type ATPase n=1 Tax=Rubeoparvulum massiliense TaxID=1631346 RepID=UPI00069DBE1A|nr:heavy metal translocating P-type ATPase [Rubeoparvulum massiliense]
MEAKGEVKQELVALQLSSPFWLKFGELIAALVSGILIMVAWSLEGQGWETGTVLIYLFAFMIGGFAKAKEGIQALFLQRKLSVELLMLFAAIGSAIIGYWTEGAILIFIFALSGALESYTMQKSHREISALMSMEPHEAHVLRDGLTIRLPVEDLVMGDIVVIKPGEQVPVDGVIVRGESHLNQAAITGESSLVYRKHGDEVYAGTMNQEGLLHVQVTKPSTDTLFQKIITMVQAAQQEKSPSQLFIERFEALYVKVVLVVVALLLFLPHYLLGWSWNETIYRAMVFMVVASPCALVASIMPATLSAISNGARQGILLKGGAHLESLGTIRAIAFDKTGTLSTGKPIVTDLILDPSIDEREFLTVVATIEAASNHPLALAIVQYADPQIEGRLEMERLEDMPGQGITASIQGEEWRIGNGRLMQQSFDEEIKKMAQQLEEEGKTIVYVQKAGQVIGIFALRDGVRQGAKQAVAALKGAGIHTVLITGDSPTTAAIIGVETGVDEVIAQCLPEDKVLHVKRLRDQFRHVAMVGDGINDAPALATANVGIAMGEGTDVALETADVVLMKNDLQRIAATIQLSQKMNRIIKQNIVFSIAVILLLIGANFFQLLDLPLGVIGHEGSTILVILNGLRLLRTRPK